MNLSCRPNPQWRALGTWAFGCVFACALVTGHSRALGTVTVYQNDGTVQRYERVKIRIIQQSLRLTTADGNGTLVISKAACTVKGSLQVCLPYTLTLVQNGKTEALDFQQGTLYANLTSAPQQLPLSSTSIPPNGVVLSLRTKIGTLLNLNGTIDEMRK